MIARVRQIRFYVLRWTAMGMFGAYLIWNFYWITRGRMAPSMLVAFMGVPSPTTGLTRSLLRLWTGDIAASFAYHPLAVPIALLFVVSLGWLAVLIAKQKRLLLPQGILGAWMCLLIVSWIIKLCSSRAYW